MSYQLFQTSKQQKTAVLLGSAALVLMYFIHQYVFNMLEIPVSFFTYSLLSLYLFFGLFSLLLLVILFQVRSRNFDLLGLSFLIVTTVKMLACFLLARPILISISTTAAFEKINFFVLFFVFLTIETLVTILILNQNQESSSGSPDLGKK